jgi:DNA repair protein RadC
MSRPSLFTPTMVREAERAIVQHGACPLCGATDADRTTGALPGSIRGPEDVLAHAKARRLLTAAREHFAVLLLNARHEVKAWETISIGSLNASIVHPREVFRSAVLASAASIVLVHNHPSGDPEPSEEDRSITKRLVEAGELLGIGVLDHVIVARRGVVSFRERRLL